MKKFVAKLALALLPLAVYFAVFVAFEPNNYFGLREDGNGNAPIARLRAYQQNPQVNIILGDSRMAHFDMELVDEVSGLSWSNVSYGGASLEESIDEFYYLYEQNPDLERVVFGLSFYTLNAAYRTVNRMSAVETQLENPAAYLFNLEYNINTLTVIGDKLAGRPDVEETAEHTPDEYQENGAPLPYRRDLIDYAATLYGNCAVSDALPERVYDEEGNLANAAEMAKAMREATPAQSRFSINEEALEKLLGMADFCAQHDIALTIVLPRWTKACASWSANRWASTMRCSRRSKRCKTAAHSCWTASGKTRPTGRTRCSMTDFISTRFTGCPSGPGSCFARWHDGTGFSDSL